MNYRYAPSSEVLNSRQLPVPFTLTPSVVLTENGGEYEYL